ncbi:ZIP family metal transporter [Ramlibacter solisilvae]|uniref:Dihydroorotate dehydrogenase n=1 Tax=Ramlibacter tataouinensis TaxID=94132 RepID=A0A127JWR9_9BURK|nr:ZIP family metal transporter [Ramlibacter tataouinensis]AMO24458.1 dihydroorotate dehydrogenase [Ramlibacter tataouinensis]
MTFLSILIATLGAGIGSVWLAAGLMRIGSLGPTREHSTYVGPRHLLSLAAGALLATAFMHLLPEAFESGAGADKLFTTLLAGVVFFFLLDKAELWHHGHEHHHDTHDHRHLHVHAHAHAHEDRHGHAHPPLRSGGWAVITGDSVHCFGDGILIASAFVADPRLGWVAALAVLAHEVPHHIGDLAVMRMTSANRGAALAKVSLAGAVTALGGAAGYWLVERLVGGLPYFLVVASSSFVYVALADLVPQLQQRLSARETAVQIAWLLVGIGMVTGASRLVHAH